MTCTIAAKVNNDLKTKIKSEAEKRKRTEASLIRKILTDSLEDRGDTDDQ